MLGDEREEGTLACSSSPAALWTPPLALCTMQLSCADTKLLLWTSTDVVHWGEIADNVQSVDGRTSFPNV